LEQLSESTSGAVMLDMSGVSFIDSIGLRVLVHVHQPLSARGRLLILCDVSTSTLRLLEISGLRQSLNLFGPT